MSEDKMRLFTYRLCIHIHIHACINGGVMLQSEYCCMHFIKQRLHPCTCCNFIRSKMLTLMSCQSKRQQHVNHGTQVTKVTEHNQQWPLGGKRTVTYYYWLPNNLNTRPDQKSDAGDQKLEMPACSYQRVHCVQGLLVDDGWLTPND